MKVSKIICLFIIYTLITNLILNSKVNYVKIVPERPCQGDVVKIVVRASPYERVKISISFKKYVNVSDGRYEYKVYGIKIPLLPNKFTVKALGVKSLYVSARIFLFFWITKGSEAVNGTATLSQANVFPGTYDVVIHGRALENSTNVKIIVEASTELTADDNGYLEYSYDTDVIPLGNFTVKVGSIIRNVTLHKPLLGFKK